MIVKLVLTWYTVTVAEGKITKYILGNLDNTNSQGKPPYWFLVGLFLSAVAFIIGSVQFIVVSFLVGSTIGVLFGYAKSRLIWKHWPYWLRGGVIGGGVALIYAVLLYSCAYSVSGYAVFGCMGLFQLWGPAYPVGLIIAYFQPIFNYSWIWAEGYSTFIAVPVWFVFGSLIGTFIGFVKNKKSPPK